jgi:riboflavin kinase/FMN adenylyltransferase
MKVYKDLSEIRRNENSVVTIGTFDGFHLAHREIINRVVAINDESKQKGINARSFIVTFEPHPQEVLKSKTPDIKLLTAIDEKLRLFEDAGIENVLVIRFTEEFSKTNAKEFYEKYIYGGIGISDLVVGYDHLFGHDREGSFQTLIELGKTYNFNVHRVEEIDIDGKPVSSTRIRAALAGGKIEEANRLLGHEFGFDGIVVEGDKVGRTIGYLTVNLKLRRKTRLCPMKVFTVSG